MKRRPKPTSRSRSTASENRGESGGASPAKDSESTAVSARVEDGNGADRPDRKLKVALSIWLVFHLLAITISYTGVVEPSETQSQITEALQFYLGPTHFAADGRPVYLARGDATEQPHRLQISVVKPASDPDLLRLPIDDPRWTTVPPAGPRGLAGNDQYARWLSTAATLAKNEQPSLVAELLLPMVVGNPAIKAVRIVRLPTELTTTADDAAPPPYTAYVARKDDRVSLVQVSEPRLSTQPRGDNNE